MNLETSFWIKRSIILLVSTDFFFEAAHIILKRVILNYAKNWKTK